VGMRVRIPAVVSDLRAMPDTPKCSVDGCLNGTKRAGFSDIVTISKWVCFEGFLAIK
jgi:hypothetical protein